MQPAKILMPTDFSACANSALGHAVDLAEHFGAALHLLHVVVLHQDDPHSPGHAFPGLEELHQHMEEAASSEMRRWTEDPRAAGLEVVEAQSRHIAAAPAILQYADREGVDLIVLGTHGRRGLRRFLLGSVTEEVVRSASCPVLTLREGAEARRFRELARIVVPFDFSEDSRTALAVARDLAASYGGRIDLVHVVQPAVDLQAEALLRGYVIEFDREKLYRRAEQRLSQAVEKLGPTAVPVERHLLDGHVASELTQHAETSGADLIVLASHGLSGLQHFLLGSVAEKVIRSAACPVLTLRPPPPA